MDKVILNANSEISTLQAKLSGTHPSSSTILQLKGPDMQNNQTQLHKKNQELIDLYRDKNRKYTQITNLYNILKSRAMRTQMQTAATDSVSRTLESLGPVCRDKTTTGNTPDVPQTPRPSAYPAKEGVEQLHRYQRSGTGSSKGAKGKRPVGNMPPPTRPVVRNGKSISMYAQF